MLGAAIPAWLCAVDSCARLKRTQQGAVSCRGFTMCHALTSWSLVCGMSGRNPQAAQTPVGRAPGGYQCRAQSRPFAWRFQISG